MTIKSNMLAAASALLLGAAAPAQAQIAQSFPLLIASLSTTPIQVKGARGTLQWLSCGNANTGTVYVQAFDVTPATSITLGTTTPNASFAIAAGAPLLPLGMSFLNGLKIAATTTATGNTAPATPIPCTAGFN